jgi:hypothetical protein
VETLPRRALFDAFRLRVEIDRNDGQIRLKALVSSAFGEAKDLGDLGDAGDPALSVKAIPLRRFVLSGEILVPVECIVDLVPRAGKSPRE